MEEVRPMQDMNDFKKFSPYKYGLFKQRELFKQACYGAGLPNFDLMSDCIQNLKCDLKNKMVMEGYHDDVIEIEKILDWYQTLEQRHTKMTEDGPQVLFPGGLKNKVIKNLTRAYERLVKIMDMLGFLE